MYQALGGAIQVRSVALFNTEFIYAYGFLFSVILAIIYIPVYQNLQSVSNGVGPEDGKDGKHFFGTFHSLLSIIAPLLTSGVSDLVKSLST
jgi:hypothetical protein